MLDADIIIAKKGVSKKTHLQIVNVLKEFIGVTTIRKGIFDLGINFTIGKLLAFAPAVEKQFIKAISDNKAI